MTINKMRETLSLLEICCGKSAKIISINSNIIIVRQNDETQFWEILENGGVTRLGI